MAFFDCLLCLCVLYVKHVANSDDYRETIFHWSRSVAGISCQIPGFCGVVQADRSSLFFPEWRGGPGGQSSGGATGWNHEKTVRAESSCGGPGQDGDHPRCRPGPDSQQQPLLPKLQLRNPQRRHRPGHITGKGEKRWTTLSCSGDFDYSWRNDNMLLLLASNILCLHFALRLYHPADVFHDHTLWDKLKVKTCRTCL